MEISKFWCFVIGAIFGAIFLGDAGGDALKGMFEGLREGSGPVAERIGETLTGDRAVKVDP